MTQFLRDTGGRFAGSMSEATDPSVLDGTDDDEALTQRFVDNAVDRLGPGIEIQARWEMQQCGDPATRKMYAAMHESEIDDIGPDDAKRLTAGGYTTDDLEIAAAHGSSIPRGSRS